MGWSFNCSPSRLKDELADLTSDESCERLNASGVLEKHVRKCLAHKYFFDNPGAGRLWTVWEYWNENQWGRVLGQKTRYIGYDLIQCKARCWGHKGMTSESGVGDVSCPIKYLEMVPERPCHKSIQCSKDAYGPNACTCGGCHGCGVCWDRAWRKLVLAAVDHKDRALALIKTLRKGDTIMLKNCTRDRWPYDQDDGKLPSAIKLKWVDYEKTLAAKQGLELED